MSVKKEVKLETKEIELTVHEVESDAVIVNVDGWRVRVYFEENTTIVKPSYGQKVRVQYTGDIEDVHSIKFEKIK